MNAKGTRRWFLQLALGGALLRAAPARADGRLVLVVGSGSPVTELTSFEVHKLFIGLTVTVQNRRLHAIRNDSDALMREVFYQNIISMSESTYDRRMLALTLQQAGQPPPVLEQTKAVFDALAADPDSVSFAWETDALRDGRIRVLRVLWHR